MINWNELSGIQKEASLEVLKRAGLGNTIWSSMSSAPGALYKGVKKDFSQMGTNMEKNIASRDKGQYGAAGLWGPAALYGTAIAGSIGIPLVKGIGKGTIGATKAVAKAPGGILKRLMGFKKLRGK